MPDLLSKYQAVLKEKQWQSDPFQLAAVAELQRLLVDLNPVKTLWPFKKKRDVLGVYLHGGVGRGKSMLMDMFFDEASQKLNKLIKKRRVHFHEFMIETHNWLHQNRGEAMDDLLPRYAEHVAGKSKLLCFDEFHVVDVADAMIIGRLFTALLNQGVVVVATSNWPPSNLYEGGLQRDRFLPFIKLLQEKMVALHLDSDTDYRTLHDQDQDLYYFYPLNPETKSKMDQLYSELTDNKNSETKKLKIKGRTIDVQYVDDVATFTFAGICEKAYGAEDYIEIAQNFDTVFIHDIPPLGYDRRNETKRLILLIDCLYEAKCRVIISAASAIEKLYRGHDHAFEFDRTISRLMEMQSFAYHEQRFEKA